MTWEYQQSRERISKKDLWATSWEAPPAQLWPPGAETLINGSSRSSGGHPWTPWRCCRGGILCRKRGPWKSLSRWMWWRWFFPLTRMRGFRCLCSLGILGFFACIFRVGWRCTCMRRLGRGEGRRKPIRRFVRRRELIVALNLIENIGRWSNELNGVESS